MAGLREHKTVVIIGGFVWGVTLWLYASALPSPLFDEPYSTVVEAREGQLLGASIASDGQWRFPADKDVPERFAQAIITFEDKRFRFHPGFDPLSMARALWQNIRSGRIVSGGSTLSMQVIRMSRDSPPRTFFEKAIEIVLATRLELAYSKEEILEMYSAHAPFGGNVVGLEAACWRYFGRSPQHLSWAEAATLAVLPNTPALIHPGRNREALRAKRDMLLDRLHRRGVIDSLTYRLACAETLPEAPKPLPRHARHLLARVQHEGFDQRRLVSSIDMGLQKRVEEKLQRHHERLRANQIHNGAVLVLDVNTGQVLAYVGNVENDGGERGEEVDVITAPRSTGSILKPILYAASLHEGGILRGTLLPDVPVRMSGFAPENFSRQYDGAVPADEALIRSLNVPSVFLLKDFRYEKFHALLRQLGMTTLTQEADHYGLSLILGGAEGTLWDVTGIYASMARTLNRYFERPGKRRYTRTDIHAPSYLATYPTLQPVLEESSPLGAGAIYQTLQTLTALYRPLEEAGWKIFQSSRKIAWKTGTSFGFRDGWAVGVTPDYAVGVWIGNADGEGRAGLTGTTAAAPLLFDVFSLLPPGRWFQPPMGELKEIRVCRRSGQRAGLHCPATEPTAVCDRGLETPACQYHRLIHVSEDEKFQLHANCAQMEDLKAAEWFVLPPIQEHYYRREHVSYKPVPPFAPGCSVPASAVPMELVYPQAGARIFVPRDFSGAPGESVFELAHRDDDVSVYWHLDGAFLGETRGAHRMALTPSEGLHTLTLVDQHGYSLEENFTVISGL